MTVAYPPARTALEFTAGNPDQQLRTTASVVNNMLAGKLNTTIFLTLTPGAATTMVQDPRISAQTTAGFCPTTANAAVALAAGIWATLTSRQMVVHHAVNAAVDQTFNCSLIG